MIEVENLTKYYGSFLAVDGISFGVDEGEIIGVLGPNGAGKTTLIRMLTCFMPASSGRATVNGYDIFTRSLQVRESVGYMPESVPLYDDMRVEEYLKFRGQLKAVGGLKLQRRIDEVLKQCQLTDRRRQIIATLSKGYRQRVGLAESLLGDPKVLILDEPTIGLDPGQIREARKLIQHLGQRHTVLLSSHILHEVEQICSRIIIIASGRVVANGRLEELKTSLGSVGRTILEGKGSDADGLKRAIGSLHGVSSVRVEGDDDYQVFVVETENGADVRQAVGELAVRRDWTIRELHTQRPTLEEFYIHKIAEQNLSRQAG
ncbi:MAG: ATP-binding cassette domain-containing protein [Anaerolineaceae bacterium]|nr:ATP-binding cassette domain-containing protein [Anaerolineaceae bacterium]